MIDYRKIIRSQDLRTRILSVMGWIPDKWMLRIQFYIQMGRSLNLKKAKTFSEKIQAYKYYYRNPDMLRCTDKYEVRKYVKEKGLENILVPLYGIFNSAKEIDFNSLPKQFVAKTTDGGGGSQIFICEDKEKLSEIVFRKQIQKWMSAPKAKKHMAREWAYENGYPRRILIEQLLVDEKSKTKDIIDYKFFCFNGKYKIMQMHKDRYISHKLGFWDENLKFIPDVTILYPCFDKEEPLPSNIKEMVEISEKLSEDFPFVRVDLYSIGGKIYFSELTFYPASGYIPFKPESFDRRLGDYFDCPLPQS